jgi:hypothetical protein
VVREYVVREGREQDFRLIYGPNGIWHSLLRLGSTGYQGCELRSIGPRWFELWDYWTSHVEFEAFRDRHQREIRSFRHWISTIELIEQEKVLGMFYESGHGPEEDEAGMVPA